MTAGRLAGHVAVVTGGGSGLGRGSAERLSAEGATLPVVDIDGDAAKRTAAALSGPALAVTADVSDEDQVEGCLRAAVDAFGHVDLHHLNAGVFGTFTPLPDLPADEFDRVLAVNTRGQFLGLRAAFRQYRRQGSGGAIVLTASIASLIGSADLLAYQTSKHATLGLMRGAAMYGGPIGVRVNAVAPGIVPTNLLSDDAAYLTGQVVPVDGGAPMVNTVRPSGGAGAWDTAAVDQVTYWTSGAGNGSSGNG